MTIVLKNKAVLNHLTVNLKPLKTAKTTGQPIYSLKNCPSGELNITEKYRWYVNGVRQVIASKKEIILNSYCSFRGTHL